MSVFDKMVIKIHLEYGLTGYSCLSQLDRSGISLGGALKQWVSEWEIPLLKSVSQPGLACAHSSRESRMIISALMGLGHIEGVAHPCSNRMILHPLTPTCRIPILVEALQTVAVLAQGIPIDFESILEFDESLVFQVLGLPQLLRFDKTGRGALLDLEDPVKAVLHGPKFLYCYALKTSIFPTL